jgi:CheY-like chemotaxis protein
MKPFKSFFAQQWILIADESSTSRISLARALTELGATASRISLADSFEAAQALIQSRGFTIVICEYDFGSRHGFELLKAVKRNSLIVLSGMVTVNPSDTIAAMAAENDIDVFLRKPFTMNGLLKVFTQAITERLNLDHDQEVPIENALEAFQHAKNRKKIYDRVGYRSLVQFYEALIGEGRKAEAYPVIRRLIMTHPVHPDRLSTALRLAIETRNFEDVNLFYSLFLEMSPKGDEVIRHMYAAQTSAGKTLLEAGRVEEAIEQFKRALMTSEKRLSILQEIVLSCVAEGQLEHADAFLSQFPLSQRDSIEFVTLDYFVISKMQPVHRVLQRGRELIKKGHRNSEIYKILIQACKAAGHVSEAESLLLDAGRLWPDQVKSIGSVSG